jgi:hypothetical protein
VFNLTGGQQMYTLGKGGNLNAPRPVSIKNAVAITAQGLSLPMELVSSEDWAAIVEKTVSGTVPRKVYCDFAYPLANVYIWPVPSGSPQLSLYTWHQFDQFAALTDTFDLPPGYERAIRFNLAIEMAPEYGRPASAELAAKAQEALQSLRMLNRPPVEGVAAERLALAGVTQQLAGQPPQAPAGRE